MCIRDRYSAFVVKYMNLDPLDQLIRKHYHPTCYEETLLELYVKMKNTCVSVNETTDSTERKVGM